MPKPLGNSGRYMPGLDGLRAIAVFAVIAYHLNLSWVPGGLLGVGMFFVLSGYLITDILLKQHSRGNKLALGDFWIRRARRLLPAMIIMLGLVSIWLATTDPQRLYTLRGEIGAALLYMSNWRLIYHQVSYFESFGPPSPLGHLWSLAVEEQFYLVWPMLLAILVKFVPRRGTLALVILAGAAVSALAMAYIYVPQLDPSRVYYGTDTRSFALLIGAALAVVWPSWKLADLIASKRAVKALDTIGVIGFSVIVAMIAMVGEYDAFLYRGGMVVLSIATAAVVAALAHPDSWLARIIGCKPLQWFGARSYGIYLYHYPVIALSTPAAELDIFNPVRALLQILASVALAELSWRFVEEPIRHGAIGKLVQLLKQSSIGRRSSRKLMLASVCLLAVVSVSCSGQRNIVIGDSAKNIDMGVRGGGPALAGGQAVVTGGGSAGGLVPTVTNPSTDSKGSSDQHDASQTDSNGAQGTTDAPTGEVNPDADGDGDVTDKPTDARPTDEDQQSSEQAASGQNQDGAGSGQPSKDSGGSSTPPGKPQESDTPPPSKPNTPVAPEDTVTVIGDSIILDAKPYLEKLINGIVVEGKVGRQMFESDEVVEELKRNKQLGHTVVIELGTNGSFTTKQLDSLLEAIGDDRRVVLVNTRVPRKWQDVVNDLLSETIKNTPSLTLIDWYSASKGREDFFGKDGVHLKKHGAEFFANLLVQGIGH
ncbi:acyltransferase family protein [Paenibacillus sp. OV219]|uniref:acyltransferase family protein n=1 Tax=Paenibacillus sp. OV219 TaxID=1884377 RepID=UPI0008B83345|nr:acyltransferase family protein [Paenibacillus sp. OV219]SEO48074.1 Peptidoglycan/LPS O-acetylase OafA/YrhL, contains acyltransferase and SGNH-hydrolase domains [Paenibacillus sp. OV219]